MASGSGQAFRSSGTSAVAASTISAAVALIGGGETVLVTNASTSLGFVRLGASATLTASSADVPVLPGSQVLLGGGDAVTYAAAVLVAGAGQILFTRGDGSVI